MLLLSPSTHSKSAGFTSSTVRSALIPAPQNSTDSPPGPIIRINPDEIHIADPDFYDTVYAGSGRKRDKWDWITRSFGVDESLIGTLGHDEHRIRRAALSPYFSKQSVRALQPLIDRNMGILLERLRQFAVSGAPMKLDDAYAALTNGGPPSRALQLESQY